MVFVVLVATLILGFGWESITRVLTGPTYSAIANTADIVSAVLTVSVLITLYRLRRYYTFTALSPELIQRLNEHASTISQNLNDFDAFREETSEELARAEVTLASLERKLSGTSRKSVKSLLRTIESYDMAGTHQNSKRLFSRLRPARKKVNRQVVRSVYIDMMKVVQELKDRQEEQKWER